jgi:hypothetical protein
MALSSPSIATSFLALLPQLVEPDVPQDGKYPALHVAASAQPSYRP